MSRRFKWVLAICLALIIPTSIVTPLLLRAQHQAQMLEKISLLNGNDHATEMMVDYEDMFQNSFYGIHSEEVETSIWFNLRCTAFAVQFSPNPASIKSSVDCVNSLGGKIKLTLRHFNYSNEIHDELKRLDVARLCLCEVQLSESQMKDLKKSLAPIEVTLREGCGSYSGQIPREVELEIKANQQDKGTKAE